jgi:ABC-type polysaccharide/polyol phosphate transport system ATPase subunit
MSGASPTVRIVSLGKRYRIGQPIAPTDTLRDAIAARFRRRRTPAGQDASTFWALRDVSFDVHAGEVVGIVGANGAGKSTLLKILSRITEPTEGLVELRGRVGSLLEVGTGFHSELTGRENIMLSGAILGMKRAEILQRFDEIVEFAEIGRFLDTPVKQYSSGMYLRLAFAVAAHLEPDVLIVDEVLAVGDAAFQRKCLGKMEEVAGRSGRTVLFVSHNLNAVQRLCTRCVFLRQGRLAAEGPPREVIHEYLRTATVLRGPGEWIDLEHVDRTGSGAVRVAALQYRSGCDATDGQPLPDGPLELLLDIRADRARAVGSVAATIWDQSGLKLVNVDTLITGEPVRLDAGRNLVRITIDALRLNPGIYTLGTWLSDPRGEVFDFVRSAVDLEVVASVEPGLGAAPAADGVVTARFTVERLR